MNQSLDHQIRLRACDCCEYCLLPQSPFLLPFEIDHIIAVQHGGQATPDNLALCCSRCNRYKGPNIAGLDPQSGELTRLFHPRRDRWSDHFTLQGHHLVGQTPIGRTTIALLQMNDDGRVTIRAHLIASGKLPR